MAEIRVEPKGNNNRSIWPWILGALLLIGLVWAATALLDDDDREIEANRTEQPMMNNGEALPAEPERVTNDRFEDDRALEDNTPMRDNQMEDDRMLEEGNHMRNDRILGDTVINDL